MGQEEKAVFEHVIIAADKTFAFISALPHTHNSFRSGTTLYKGESQMTTLLLEPLQYHAINPGRTNLSLNMLDLHAFNVVESLLSA